MKKCKGKTTKDVITGEVILPSYLKIKNKEKENKFKDENNLKEDLDNKILNYIEFTPATDDAFNGSGGDFGGGGASDDW